ncbi:LamG-like jellyroll fold domain-containing protein [Amycolatopsis sp. NPDC059027]|uniref:LamG-like jellyroll fold domain-containing protein n=1 Tax=Amycolatopsis sp. NPDC059027 TaxID=3346709 RepID=UPI00366E69C3
MSVVGARVRAALLSLAVTAAAVVVALPPATASAATVPNEAGDEATAVAFARAGSKQVLVTSKTTETSETRANPDGSWTLTQYVHPVRVKQGPKWTPIDTTLVKKPDGTIAPKAVTVDLSLNPGGGGSAAAPIVKAGSAGKEVGLKWTGDLPVPALSGNSAIYPDVLPGVDLKVSAVPEGYTEALVIKTPEAARNPGLLKVPFGLYTKNTTVSIAEGQGRGKPANRGKSDGLTVKDSTGRVMFTGDASRMWDSSGAGSQAEVQLGKGGGRREATMAVQLDAGKVLISPDQAFLSDPATKYPVSLDPDNWCTSCGIQAHAVVQSGFPEAHNYNATIGDLSDLKAGYEDYDPAGTSRSYIQMDTSQIGGTEVKSASLNTTVIHTYNCSDAKDTDLWLSGPFDSSITWNHQPGWSYYLSSVNVANCHDVPNVVGQFDATHAARDAAAGHWPNVSLALVEDNTGGGLATWRRFDLNPYLQVNYNSRPNPPESLSMQQGALPCTSGETRPWVYTKTPQLAGNVSDPDGGTLYTKFAVAFGSLGNNVYTHDNGANPVVVGTPGPNGRATAQLAAVPDGWINEDGVYNWSMQVTDGELWSNWVGNCEFTVDTKVPQAPAVAMTNATAPAVQGDEADFSVWVEMATDGFFDLDRFIYTTDGSEPQPQGSPSVPARQGTDANGKMVAIAGLKTTAVNGNQNFIKVRAVNKAGTPGPDAVCLVIPGSNPALDGPSCSYHLQPLTPGKNLAGAWAADEASGTTLADTAAGTPGNTGLAVHPATTTGGAGWQAGYNHGNSWTHPDTNGYSEGTKGAMSLDGASGYAQTAGPVVDTSKSFTFAAWAKLADTSHSQTMIAQDGAQSGPLFLQYNKEDNAWEMRLPTADEPTPADVRAKASGPPQIGVWTHLAGAYDASTHVATLYVDGVKQSTAIAQAWAGSGAVVFGAGKWAGNRADFFHGQIDDVQVWQRTLSAQDVHDLANVAAPLANYGLAEGCGPELMSKTSKVPSLQGAWALGETGGNSAKDSTSVGNTITMSGGYSWVAGYDGGAVYFDGATGWGSTAVPVLDTSGSYTVSTWVKPDDLAATYTALSQNGSRVPGFLLRYAKDANRWAFGVNPADTAAAPVWATGTSAPQPGAWTLLTGTFDRASMRIRLFVNGKQEAQAEVPAVFNAPGGLVLGTEQGGRNPLKGALDETRVWDRALTADQIAAMGGSAYYDTIGRGTATPSGGVTLGTEPDGAGNPTGCAARFTNAWTGQLAAPAPANLRTDKSFTVEGWVRHQWTAADAAAQGRIDPAARALVGMDDPQASPFMLGYRSWADPKGKSHGKWSLILSTSAPDGDGSSFEVSDVDVVDNTWTHLAATYDASSRTMTLYVNGVPQRGIFATPTGNGTGITARAGAGDLLIGRGVWTTRPTDFLYGGIAGVRVYAGVRSVVDIGGDATNDDPRLLFTR